MEIVLALGLERRFRARQQRVSRLSNTAAVVVEHLRSERTGLVAQVPKEFVL